MCIHIHINIYIYTYVYVYTPTHHTDAFVRCATQDPSSDTPPGASAPRPKSREQQKLAGIGALVASLEEEGVTSQGGGGGGGGAHMFKSSTDFTSMHERHDRDSIRGRYIRLLQRQVYKSICAAMSHRCLTSSLSIYMALSVRVSIMPDKFIEHRSYA